MHEVSLLYHYQHPPIQSLYPLMFFSSSSILSSCNPATHWISPLCHALPSRPPVQSLSFAQPELPSVILILPQSCSHSWFAMHTNTTYHLTNNHSHLPAQFLSLLKFDPQYLIHIDVLTDLNRMLTRKHDRQIP